jgi:predicted small secreted protein
MRRVALAAVLAVLVTAAGCNAVVGPGTDGAERSVDVTPAAVPPPELPGVDDGRVVDGERLAGAHDRSVDASAYDLVRTRTVRVVATNRTLNTVGLRMRVAESGRAYDPSRVEESVAGYGTGGDRTTRIDVYYRNGTALQRTVDEGVTRVWRSVGTVGPVRDLSRAPFVERALAAFQPRVVERTRVDDGVRYRLQADALAAPERLRTIPTTENATAATLTATLDGRGVVHALRYDYETTYRGQRVRVTQRLRVASADGPVERPSWAPTADTDGETGTDDSAAAPTPSPGTTDGTRTPGETSAGR